jgi:hypothetical protein
MNVDAARASSNLFTLAGKPVEQVTKMPIEQRIADVLDHQLKLVERRRVVRELVSRAFNPVLKEILTRERGHLY